MKNSLPIYYLHIAIYKFEETDLGEEIHNDATDHQKGISLSDFYFHHQNGKLLFIFT